MKLCAFLMAMALHAETGRDAWLRYAPRPVGNLPAVLATFGNSALIGSARDELLRGVRGMAGKTLRMESGVLGENAIVLGTFEGIRAKFPNLATALSAMVIG